MTIVLALGQLKQKDCHKFQVSLECSMRHCVKTNKNILNRMWLSWTYNLSTWDTEAGGLQIRGQLRLVFCHWGVQCKRIIPPGLLDCLHLIMEGWKAMRLSVSIHFPTPPSVCNTAGTTGSLGERSDYTMGQGLHLWGRGGSLLLDSCFSSMTYLGEEPSLMLCEVR